ncbi:MAG TPA: hypothetical protein VKE74_35830 [Gemmataceae bacterium]|nr:hypothetical protein [Gemmataceae bacterium]
MALLSTQSPTGPRALLNGLDEKQQAVAGVIAGRLTLLEAAARFRAAGGGPVEADGEAVCRSVIGWVHLALSERPERAEEVSARLESELQSYIGRARLLACRWVTG